MNERMGGVCQTLPGPTYVVWELTSWRHYEVKNTVQEVN